MRLILVPACAMIVGLPLATQLAAAKSCPNPFEANDDVRQPCWNRCQQRGTECPGYTTPEPYCSGSNPGWNTNSGGNRRRQY